MTIGQLLFFAILFGIAFLFVKPIFFGGARISPADAAKQVAEGMAVLVDVREPGEWKNGVAAPAALLSLTDLKGARREWAPFLTANNEKLIVLYCASGMRSGAAASILKKEEFRVANLGGFRRWAEAGLPVK